MIVTEVLGLIVLFFILYLGLTRFAKKWNASNPDDLDVGEEKPHPPKE